ncbi:hypothetical protein XH98_06445 [Bradyrhizobium sp. CCBAU 51745]|nr:hypothetical protein [Bradyrhizobium sp. CCBAU 45384]MDA9438767.1 hypothetical protein [Bradyrhizobium sp. CCBAU 51745]
MAEAIQIVEHHGSARLMKGLLQSWQPIAGIVQERPLNVYIGQRTVSACEVLIRFYCTLKVRLGLVKARSGEPP